MVRIIGLSKKILVFVLSLLLSLLCAEAYFTIVRKTSRVYPVSLVDWEHQLDSEVGWIIKPNQKGKISSEAFGSVDVFINSKGLRDYEYEYSRNNKKRIVLLGDSQLFGIGVSIDDTVAKVMEKKLQNIEVINMGIIGYGSDQEYLFLIREGVKYHPDLVILLYTGNDFWYLDKYYAHAYYYRKPIFTEKNGDIELNYPVNFGKSNKVILSIYKNIDSVKNSFWFNSYVYRRFSDILFEKTIGPSSDRYKNNMKISKLILLKMNDYLEENKTNLIVVFTNRENPFEYELAEYLKNRGVRTIDVDLGKKQDYYIPQESHLSRKGHQKIAEEIMIYLGKNKDLVNLVQKQKGN